MILNILMTLFNSALTSHIFVLVLSRATSHGAPWLRWPEDGEEGNGGTPSPGVIEHYEQHV